MKWILIGTIGAALLAVIIAGCTKKDDEVNGGTTVNYDKDAPKEIVSTELISMQADISTKNFSKTKESGLEYGQYLFDCSLDKETGKVTGTYKFIEQYAEADAKEYSFETDLVFMTELEQIIRDSKIAANNGKYHKTNGIPDGLGYYFKATYASGEQINCSNNQSTEIPLESIKKLDELFNSTIDSSRNTN